MTRCPDGGENSQLRPAGWDSPCKRTCLDAGLPTCGRHGCSLCTATAVRQRVTRRPALRDLCRHDSLHFSSRDGLPSRCRISNSRCLARPPRRAGPVPPPSAAGCSSAVYGAGGPERGVPNWEGPRWSRGSRWEPAALARAADEARAVPSATAGDLNAGQPGRALGRPCKQLRCNVRGGGGLCPVPVSSP